MMGTEGQRSFRLQLALTYAAGLAPGALLLLFVPQGEHVRWAAFCLAMVLGFLLWMGTRKLVKKWMPERDTTEILIFILLPYQLWTGHVVVAFGNRGLDDSRPVPHQVTVLERERRTKGNDQIVIPHWRAGEAPFKVQGTYDAGTPLTVYSHPGKWGMEWVETPLARRL